MNAAFAEDERRPVSTVAQARRHCYEKAMLNQHSLGLKGSDTWLDKHERKMMKVMRRLFQRRYGWDGEPNSAFLDGPWA